MLLNLGQLSVKWLGMNYLNLLQPRFFESVKEPDKFRQEADRFIIFYPLTFILLP